MQKMFWYIFLLGVATDITKNAPEYASIYDYKLDNTWLHQLYVTIYLEEFG